MMNQVAAFLWSLLTVFLAGTAVFLDPLWIADVGMIGRIVAVVLWLFLLMALIAAGIGRGWGLRYGLGLVAGAAITYAVGGLITLEPLWFNDIAAWWRVLAVTAVAMTAIGISEGPGILG